MRWKMELDYKQLKGELGLDHYEAWLGWYHHTAIVRGSALVTLFARGRPDTPEGRAAPAAALQVLDRPLPNLPPTHRRNQLALTLDRHDE